MEMLDELHLLSNILSDHIRLLLNPQPCVCTTSARHLDLYVMNAWWSDSLSGTNRETVFTFRVRKHFNINHEMKSLALSTFHEICEIDKGSALMHEKRALQRESQDAISHIMYYCQAQLLSQLHDLHLKLARRPEESSKCLCDEI